jgi:hypothetical protein
VNKLKLMADQCTNPILLSALRQAEPAIDAIRVGDPGAPPLGTKDPDLPIAAETLGRVLLTNDRSTMPGHLVDHYAAGRHTAGIMLMRGGFRLARYVQEVLQHWNTTTADEWIDRTVYIP